MLYYPNESHEPALNLAMEEYLLESSQPGEEILFFYVNAPSIIIGRHQNTQDEINRDFVREHKIQLVRRRSGGGAVYHDLGNLNFSIIMPGARNASADFSYYLRPILTALQKLGIPAELSGRNDLTLYGAKFSGNAYYHNRSGSVLHGTLLYDTDLDVLSQALNPNPEKLRSKGVASVRSRVCNLKESLPKICSIDALRNAIIQHFSETETLKNAAFSEADFNAFMRIADSRYRADSWTYGESPAFNYRRSFRAPCGWIDFRANIRESRILEARFYGDFFSSEDVSLIENALNNIRWTPREVTVALKPVWERCFPNYSSEAIIHQLFQV